MEALDVGVRYHIYDYLFVEDIINMSYINNHIAREVHSPYFKNHLRKRDAPMIFNIIDNYCKICNMKRFLWLKMNYAKCSHLYNIRV